MKILKKKIGYRFRAPDLLEEALRHASTAEGGTQRSYQRLEYLGDAVLNLCIAEEMYRTFPSAEEGALSKARSALINNRNLVRVGETIGVPDALRIASSVRGKGGGVTRKMVADVVEAIAWAIFLDGGYDAARRVVIDHFWGGDEAAGRRGGSGRRRKRRKWKPPNAFCRCWRKGKKTRKGTTCRERDRKGTVGRKEKGRLRGPPPPPAPRQGD